MASPESEFPRVFRGYDPEEVDRTVARLRRELLASKTEFDRLQAEASQALEASKILELELKQVDSPTFAGFGHAFDSILKRAEKEAAAIVSRAAADAHNLKNATERERASIIEIAKEQAKAITTLTEARASEILHDALSRSAETVAASEQAAREVVEIAQQEAANVRRASTTEVSQVISTAKREAEIFKSEAAREIAEMKLVLAANANASGAKITKALIEVLRIDADAAAHRDEAEREYLEKHQEAVHTTSLYIEESQAELKAIRAQAKVAEFNAHEAASQARRELDALRTAVDKRALATLSDAAQSAAAMIETAERVASELRQRTEAQAQTLLSDVEKQRLALTKILEDLGDLTTAAQSAAGAATTSPTKVAAPKKATSPKKAATGTVKAAPKKATATKQASRSTK
ncbi:MAG: hypothetical protein RLZZ600_586 [Actinomycetota bacterium]